MTRAETNARGLGNGLFSKRIARPLADPSSLCLLALFSLVVGGCSCDPTLLQPPPAPSPRVDASVPPDIASGFVDTGIGSERIVVTRVLPNHGPFVGGNSAIVRGAGFSSDAVVTVGSRMVQPAETDVLDANRIAIVLPAGEVGPADVTVEVGDLRSTLPDGYFYDSFYLEPNRGSTAGGTRIDLIGMGDAFQEGDTFLFGGVDCSDLEIVSSSRAVCNAPPGAVGPVDVTLSHDDGTEIVLVEGYEYYDSSDPFNGGLGGGPLAGTMNVTVIDAMTGAPVSEAFAIVGEDLQTEHQGLTGLTGQITFSGPDMFGDQTVHVAKHCYEKTSFVSFDAQDVTIFLVPWMDPMCAPPNPGPMPPGRGLNGSFVSGELIWLGPNEFGANPWDNVPEEREGWERVSYVYATQQCAGDERECINPDPTLGGGQNRVLQQPIGRRGYPFRIFMRPAAFAVYAMAGLENKRTGEFLPYVMGVARDVLAGPGEEVTGVEVVMNIPLDHYLDVRLTDLPEPAQTGPDRFEVGADIDLGGEGLIVRRVSGVRIDVSRARTPERNFRFFAQPALLGELSDGRVRVEASWLTGDFGADPSSHVRRTGIRQVDQEVVVDRWVGIPQATSPAFGERIPTDRVLRWNREGGVEPTFHLVLMIGGDGNPAWRMFVRGDQESAAIPDLSSIPEISDISTGIVTWAVYAVSVPGLDFNDVSYADLSDRRWRAWGIDVFTARR